MDIDDIRLALDVAARGGFAKTARALDRDPSSVSRAVAALETRLGVRLFQRTTRRMSTTEAGARYLDRARAAIEELDIAAEEAAASGPPSGTLRLTASVAFAQRCLVPLLGAFRADYPDLAIDLLMTDTRLDMVADRVDLAIRLAPALEEDAVAAKLMDTRYRVVAGPDYLATHGVPKAPADLADRDCPRFSLPGYRNQWRFRTAKGRVDTVPVGGGLVISNALALRQAALNGLGPTLLADWLIDADVAAGRLIDLFPDLDVTATEFDTAAWFVYPSRAFLPTKTRVAIDFLRTHIATPNPRTIR